MPYGTVNADLMTTSDGVSSSGLYGFKNRIINGAMVIDQRNAGASVTPANNDYTLDRWKISISQSSKFTVQQNAGSVTPPSGFTNYLGVTSSSAYSVLSTDYFLISQRIEGFNFADLNWGTSNAQSVTLSFWVRSSLTGTFGGSIENNANNRSYPFSYTISSANTWTQISVTIAGDTSGTWIGATNGIGAKVWFSLGAGSTVSTTAGAWASGDYQSATGAVSVVGTNGATFYITGVQLEKGSTATSFDYRPYGTELSLCQRYYWKSLSGTAVAATGGIGAFANATTLQTMYQYPVPMRSSPTFVISGCNVANGAVSFPVTSVGTSYIGPNGAQMTLVASAGTFTLGQCGYTYDVSSGTGYSAFSAEL